MMPHDVHEEVCLPVVARMFVLLPCVVEGAGFRLCLIAVFLKIVGASQAATHTAVADYSPSFDRCLSAQKGEKLIALPHTPDGSGEWIKLQRLSDGAQGWMPTVFIREVRRDYIGDYIS